MSMEVDPIVPETIQARFVSESGEEAGPPLDLPTSVNISQLGRICNAILQNVSIETSVCVFVKTNCEINKNCIKINFFLGGSIKLSIFYR